MQPQEESKIKLKASDDESLVLDVSRKTVQNVIGSLRDGFLSDVARLQLNSRELRNLVRYCELWEQNEAPPVRSIVAGLAPWEAEFCSRLSNDECFALVERANFLDARPLMDLLCLFIAMQIKPLVNTPAQEVEYFGTDIVNGAYPQHVDDRDGDGYK